MSLKHYKSITRRGLTLLEVLAASAMLAIITAACLPLLAEARRYADTVREPDRFADLVLIADAVMADPEVFGLDAEVMTKDGFEAEISTLDLHDRVKLTSHDEASIAPLNSVSIRLLTGEPASNIESDGEQTFNHGWLVFRLGRASTLRYIELPEPQDTEEDLP